MAKYFPVWPSYWRGARRRWDDQLKLLGLYLLTCEHRNLEGYYFLPKGYVVTDLEWDLSAVGDRLSGLEDAGFCMYDEEAEVVFVCKALEHQAPKSERQVSGAVASLRKVPTNRLWPPFLAVCEVRAPELHKALGAASTDPSSPSTTPGGDPSETVPDVSTYAGVPTSTARDRPQRETDPPAARDHMRLQAEEIATTLGALADRYSIPSPSVDDVVGVLGEHPDRSVTHALDSLKKWCSRSNRPEHLTGAFRSTLSKAPKVAPAATPVQIHKAPTDKHRALWATTVETLQERAPLVFDSYLSGLTLVGVHGESDEFVLSAPRHVVDWIASRHVPLLVDVLGRPVHLRPAAEGAAA